MGTEASMDFDPVDKLAGKIGEARKAVEQGRTALSGGPGAVTYVPVPVVPASNAFGDTSRATSAGSAHADLQTSADDLAEILIGVLTSDESRLRKVIRAFKELDDDLADRLFAGAAKGFDVYSAHVHSHGLHKYDDFVRSDQIGKLHEAMNRGPSLLGADLNVVTHNGDNVQKNASGGAIHDLKDEGYTVYSGAVGEDGKVVGTSPSGTRIDHVAGSPAFTVDGPPVLFDGATSDHDGQRVDVEIPNW
ncbi:endonuclease/exonuclease/phosphatase family protein [Nonomuraea sp. SMC257]|uniref:Endonuclease/exonuclease/phosphatase family protein n=1 Tax=Nonomuraea montanisoli TaxID=2741721 RepID=A0A7Y6I4P3_9ACTN|nr:endonuclease/exonuclease/phosphatase family protein [Nonomuraea montanisoli]NUW31484.1 endonuclease/exonuclease/phosphatase family protein [Nonomuraea montanisoli]